MKLIKIISISLILMFLSLGCIYAEENTTNTDINDNSNTIIENIEHNNTVQNEIKENYNVNEDTVQINETQNVINETSDNISQINDINKLYNLTEPINLTIIPAFSGSSSYQAPSPELSGDYPIKLILTVNLKPNYCDDDGDETYIDNIEYAYNYIDNLYLKYSNVTNFTSKYHNNISIIDYYGDYITFSISDMRYIPGLNKPNSIYILSDNVNTINNLIKKYPQISKYSNEPFSINDYISLELYLNRGNKTWDYKNLTEEAIKDATELNETEKIKVYDKLDELYLKYNNITNFSSKYHKHISTFVRFNDIEVSISDMRCIPLLNITNINDMMQYRMKYTLDPLDQSYKNGYYSPILIGPANSDKDEPITSVSVTNSNDTDNSTYKNVTSYDLKKYILQKTVVKAPKVTNKFKKSAYFKIKVSDKKSKKPIKCKIKVKVYTGKKFKTYKLKTDKKGIAKINTKSLKRGSHKVIITQNNNKYDISSQSKIIIK